MFRSRFFWQLYGGYVVVVLVFAAVVGLAVSDWVVDDTRRDMRRAMHNAAVMLGEIAAPALQGQAQPDLQARVKSLGGPLAMRLTVIARDGSVLADSERDPMLMSDHSRRPEVLKAIREGEGEVSRRSDTLEKEMRYLAQRWPLDLQQPLQGLVRASLPMAEVGDRLARVRFLVMLGAGTAAGIALLFGWFITGRLTRPIKSMTEVAQAMAAGDHSQRVRSDGRDEMGVLARAFNEMAQQLDARINTITEDRNTLQTIFAGMIEGVLAVDREDRLIHLNDVAARLLGVDPDQIRDRRIWESVRVPEIAAALSACLRDGRARRSEVRVIRGDDEVVLEINTAALRDGSAALSGAVLVFHDVTEFRRLEAVRRDFVVNASHELKTPITAIRGFLDTLVADPQMPPEVARRFVARAGDQAARLSDLVSDLLQLSRLEAPTRDEDVETLDLRDLARSSLRAITSVAQDKGLELRLQLPEYEVELRADASTIRLVIDNLIVNAVQYTGGGGRVVVGVRSTSSAAILDVEDTGMGIAAEHLDRIFERFYRVDEARSRELGGTGLGLAIVKHAVTVLGGQIEVQSVVGEGSTFSVRLPLAH